MYEVAVIGAGNMGGAMVSGWLEAGVLKPGDIVVSDRDEKKRDSLVGRYGVESAGGNEGAVESAELVLLAVKPQDYEEVLESIAGKLGEEKTLVSIVAGLPIGSIRAKTGEGPSIVRVMPNMAAGVRASILAYSMDPGTGPFEPEKVLVFLTAMGQAIEVDEGWMDLVTAVSGSGPAYFFLMVEALEDAGVAEGLPREVARQLARETLWGAAKVLKESGREAKELREAVSSPGGTTLAALEELEKADFRGSMKAAIKAARKRAAELSR